MIQGELVRMFIKRHAPLALVVSLGSGILSFSLTLLFPAAELQDAERIAMSWPKIMKDLFGDPIYGFTNIYGWLHLQVFHITYWVIFGIFASLLASSIIAKEVEGKTIDILLSYALTRTEMLLSRLTGLFIIMALSISPLFLGCLFGILILGQPLQPVILFAACFTGLLFFLVCAGVTLLISTFIPYQISCLAITWSLLAFLFFYEELLTKLVPSLDRFAFLSPFHFYRPEELLIYKIFSWSDPAILLGVFCALSFLSAFYFSRRDILL